MCVSIKIFCHLVSDFHFGHYVVCLILVQFSDDDRDGRKISINKFKLLKLYVTFYNVVDKANFEIIAIFYLLNCALSN